MSAICTVFVQDYCFQEFQKGGWGRKLSYGASDGIPVQVPIEKLELRERKGTGEGPIFEVRLLSTVEEVLDLDSL